MRPSYNLKVTSSLKELFRHPLEIAYSPFPEVHNNQINKYFSSSGKEGITDLPKPLPEIPQNVKNYLNYGNF